MLVDSNRKYNSYFQAYLKVHNIENGDEVKFHGYSSWITDKHTKFRQMKGCPYCNGYPPDVQKEFERFILEVSQC